MGRRSKSASRAGRGSSFDQQQHYNQHPLCRSQDDASIGSALSLKDQFDILVPIKLPTTSRGRKGDDASDVSSMTTDERKKMLKYFYNTRVRNTGLCQPAPSIGLCCWSEMTSSTVGTASNIMGTATASSSRRKKYSGSGGGTGVGAVAPSIDKTCDMSRVSLFDALSEEDEDTDDEHIRSMLSNDDSPIKRKRSWRKSIRRKMPWTRK